MISKLLSSKIEAVPFYKKCYNCLIWDLIIDLYSRIQKVNVKIMEFCTLQFFIAPQYNFLCLLSEAEHWGVSFAGQIFVPQFFSTSCEISIKFRIVAAFCVALLKGESITKLKIELRHFIQMWRINLLHALKFQLKNEKSI